MRPQSGDGRSTETQGAGLPKATLLVNNITALGGFAGITQMLFDTVSFNYGGYTFNKSGAFYTSIVIPEPGVYTIGCQMGTLANTQTSLVGMRQNGNQVFRDGATRQSGEGQAHGTGGTVAEGVNSIAEFQAGDTLDGFWAQPAGAPFTGTVGYFWLYAKKEGGH